jgi:catechol 2,3-dioxygenase-like lactoylglutathione lyase family enzyme
MVLRAVASGLVARVVVLVLLAVLLGGAWVGSSAGPASLTAATAGPRGQPALVSQPAQGLVREVAMFGFTAADLSRTIEFFVGLLDFELVEQFEVNDREYDALQGVFGANARVAHLRLGSQVVELTQYLTPQGRPHPVPSRSHDLWFQHVAIVVSDLDAAVARLKEAGVQQISTEPITIPVSNVAAAGIRAFKFRAPDGHPLELLYFPPGKGSPHWQETEGRLFLGIDHTAISVSSTEQSRRYYEALELQVAGESLNSGPTQELLDNLEGVRVQITGLVPPVALPGVELLNYVAPATARPRPADSTAADHAHWQATLVVADADQAFQALQRAGSALVSTRVVTVADPRHGFQRGFMARDPDGHVLRLVER